MGKFSVGDSPRSSFVIGNSRCNGGTFYSPSDVGIDEENLSRDYPFLQWQPNPDGSPYIPKKFVPEIPAKKPSKTNLTKEKFLSLNREQQENILQEEGISFSKSSSEIILWKKYSLNLSQ